MSENKQTNLIFKLTRPAKSKGGDRYEATVQGDIMSIYLPQSISRVGGQPAQSVNITITPQ
uniref:Uncharacterized protein n=1 Tax=viral metagenome TaxID=1070528 RepID=A0A6M3KAD7_9ZZZZ